MFTKLIQKNVLDELLEGINPLSNMVKSTMGPGGKFVLIKKGDYPASATKDGVTVAESIDLGNDAKGVGASLIKQAARRTVNAVGDGTTASVALAQYMINKGAELIKEGASAVAIKKGINAATKVAIENIESQAVPANDKGMLVRVATISANNDVELGKLIGETVFNVGEYGDVKVESNVGGKTDVVYKTGYTIARGFESPYFVNSERTGDVRYKNPFIALYDQKIVVVEEIMDICEYAMNEGRPLVIIAHSFDQHVLDILKINNQKGSQITAVQAEGVSNQRTEVLNDIATLSGATVLPNFEFEDYRTSAVGSFDYIRVKRDETVFVDGNGTKEKLDELISDLLKLVDEEGLDYSTLGKAKERLSKLMKGVGVLRIGAETELELGEVLDRVEDAIKATRAAFKYGVVTGGGSTYLNSSHGLKSPRKEHAEGFSILKEALKIPAATIADNAGYDAAEVVKKLLKQKDVGFNALTGKIVPIKDYDIYDPVKVSTAALLAASSVAEVVLTASGVIYANSESPFMQNNF